VLGERPNEGHAGRLGKEFDFFFSSRRRHTRSKRDWSSDVCSSDLCESAGEPAVRHARAQSKRIDGRAQRIATGAGAEKSGVRLPDDFIQPVVEHPREQVLDQAAAIRSEERRVGKGCRSRWWEEYVR